MKRRNLVTRVVANLPYKIVAIFFACLIWYVVQGEEILEINRKLEVIVDVPPGLAVREGRIHTRDVTLRGPRVLLGEFSDKPIQGFVRIPAGKKGNMRFRLDREYIPKWDNRIRLTIHDQYLNLYVDERASKSVPIRIALLGNPKAGLTTTEIRAEPPDVTITGLKADVQKQAELSTEVLDISGLSESKAFPVPLSMTGLPDYELSAQQVVVHVTLSNEQISKTFQGIAIDVIGTDRLTSIRPQLVRITVQGNSDVMARITSQDLHPFLDVTDIKPGRYDREIEVHAPEGAKILEIFPKSVSLEVYNQRRLK